MVSVKGLGFGVLGLLFWGILALLLVLAWPGFGLGLGLAGLLVLGPFAGLFAGLLRPLDFFKKVLTLENRAWAWAWAWGWALGLGLGLGLSHCSLLVRFIRGVKLWPK